MRWLVEGKWRGYKSSQDRIVYREIIADKALAAFCQDTYAIYYSDGTSLELHCRELAPRERVTDRTIAGYGPLVRDCARHGVYTVDELVAIKKAGGSQ